MFDSDLRIVVNFLVLFFKEHFALAIVDFHLVDNDVLVLGDCGADLAAEIDCNRFFGVLNKRHCLFEYMSSYFLRLTLPWLHNLI